MSVENEPTQTGGTEQQQNPRAAAMAEIAARAHEQVAADLQSFDEDTGEIHQREDEPAPVEAAPAEPEAPEQAPAPEAPRMVTIVVDGQPIQVEESRIVEAGKRTLQKDHAADKRLQEAAAARAEAERVRKQAERDAEYVRQIAEQHGIQLQAPSTDAPQARQQATGIDPQALEVILENKLYNRDAQRAAKQFEADFPDIAGDPHLRHIAAMMEQQRLETAAALGEPFGDPFTAYRKHGEAVREWLKQRTGITPTPAAVTDKAERKRTITTVQAANARAPAPAEPKQPTTSELIEKMRAQRRTGRTLFNQIGRN